MAAIWPLAPARLSTITLCPRRCDNACASTRPAESVALPAANGMTSRIGFDGYVSADACRSRHTSRSASAVAVLPDQHPTKRRGYPTCVARRSTLLGNSGRYVFIFLYLALKIVGPVRPSVTYLRCPHGTF